MPIKGVDRIGRTKELYESHKELIEAAGQGIKQFFIKMHYMVPVIKEKAVPMFSNEITQLMGRDAFFEFVDKSLNQEEHEYSPKGTLWRWPFDTNWKKYYKDEQGKIMIPLSKLEEVKSVQTELFKGQGEAPAYLKAPVTNICPDPSRKITDMTVGDLRCLLIDLIKTIKEEQE